MIDPTYHVLLYRFPSYLFQFHPSFIFFFSLFSIHSLFTIRLRFCSFHLHVLGFYFSDISEFSESHPLRSIWLCFSSFDRYVWFVLCSPALSITNWLFLYFFRSLRLVCIVFTRLEHDWIFLYFRSLHICSPAWV